MCNSLGEELKRARKKKGLSRRALAYCCGVSKASIKKIEEGGTRGSKAIWKRFSYVLDAEFDIPDDLVEEGKLKLPPLREIPTVWGVAMLPHRELKQWEFLNGVYYNIDKGNYVFLRKEGKHHVFKSVNANWLTTYTDAQLVDVEVKRMKIAPFPA